MEKKRMDYLTASDLAQSEITKVCKIDPDHLSLNTAINTLDITRAQLAEVAGNLIDKCDIDNYEGVDTMTKDVTTIQDLALNMMVLCNKW